MVTDHHQQRRPLGRSGHPPVDELRACAPRGCYGADGGGAENGGGR